MRTGPHLELLYLGFQLATFVAGHGAGDHGPRDPACSAKGLLGRYKDIRHILEGEREERDQLLGIHVVLGVEFTWQGTKT